MSDTKTNSGRKPHRESVEEQLAPGESARIAKAGDAGKKDINAGLDRLLAEMPPEGKRVRTNLARMIVEDRE